ncbi:MAG: fibronectin type III domain-containing protein [Nitrospiraceae bacterium]
MRFRSRLVFIVVVVSTYFAIPGAWALQVSPSSLTFTATQGGTIPSSQVITLSKYNKRQVGWTISDSATWISVTPTSGALTQIDQVAVSVNCAGLGAGTYNGLVTIKAIKGGTLTVPVTLTVTASTPPVSIGSTATLTWNANTDADLAGYKIHMGTSSGTYGTPIVVGNVTGYAMNNLQVGQTYYFAITAYDTAGNESLYSAEVSKSIY